MSHYQDERDYAEEAANARILDEEREEAYLEPDRPNHAVTSMPDRFYCTCGYGMTGPKRTVRGLRTHVLRANSSDAGRRARERGQS